MRHFIVLKRLGGSSEWHEVTVVRAWSRTAALRQVEKAGTQFGQYVAIPLGQWKIMRIPL